VMVLDRSGMERSQLAIRKVYEPVEGSYLSPGGDRLRDPVEQSVDFAFGMPASPAQSPYPEKAVLAFYLALGHDNDTARSYLSDASGYKADMGAYEYGTGAPLGSLKRALVKSIGYTPDENAEARREDRLVRVGGAPVGEGGAIVDEAGVPVTTQVDWVVRWERLDAGDGEPAYGWRLLQYTVS